MRRPEWLKVRAPTSTRYQELKSLLKKEGHVTVCEEALCPNIDECWRSGTATFMIMGDTCTRACRFCAIKTGNPQQWLDSEEPKRVAETVAKMQLDYIVLTSVDRDDLEDLGATHFAQTVIEIKKRNDQIITEVLTPDFNARKELIKKVVAASPDVFAHNIETVKRLTPEVRDRRSHYGQSLETLYLAKQCGQKVYTKTSIMLGLGEKESEVVEALRDLREVDCDVVTFGQYLAPTNRHKKYLPVIEYARPEVFDKFKKIADSMGFLYVASGPLVRSSYKAGEYFLKSKIERDRENELLH